MPATTGASSRHESAQLASREIVQYANATQEKMNASIDRGEQSIHIVVSRRHGDLEAQPPLLLDIDAVEHERMGVDIQG